MTLSSTTAMKALRIYKGARVTEIADARVFGVKGDSGSTYTVVLSVDHVSCSCPATVVPCKHIAAAGLQVRATK